MNAVRAALLLAVAFGAAAESLLWIDVPYVRQPPEGCGAAALSMVIRYWQPRDSNVPRDIADVDAIQARLYSRERKGIPAESMVGYLNSHRFRVFDLAGEWADLEKQIALGRPLIACLGAGAEAPLHYVVVVGVDASQALLHDPAAGRMLALPREAFEARWKQCRNWTLLALPPVRGAAMPRGVEPARADDTYQNEYLATLYFVEGNLDAALKYWNRAGKPRLRAVSFQPELPVDPLLRARLPLVAPGELLQRRDLDYARQLVQSLGFVGRHQMELVAKPESEYELQIHTAGRPSFPKPVSLLRGAPFLALHLDFYNLRQSGANWNTMLRFDANKRRWSTSFDAPFRGRPYWRFALSADARREVWNTGGDDFRLSRVEAGGELRRIHSWGEWRNAVLASARRVAGSEAQALKFRTVLAGQSLVSPERRIHAQWATRLELARLFSTSANRYARWNAAGAVESPMGRRGLLSVTATAGTSFGDPPFDELYMLGIERDNDLPLRAHAGTRSGKKGASPLARDYLLLAGGYDHTLYRHGLFTLAAGPFLDVARPYRSWRPDHSRHWLYDSGGQLKVRLPGAWEARLTYGRALREGANTVYLTVVN